MRFLITGAQGLLGSELVRALTPAYKVVATDLPEVDLTDRAAASACVATAAPERCYAANVLAAWKCCRRVTGSGRRNLPGTSLAKSVQVYPLMNEG
jgi:dTDP-4-dehydrorhamnose reductase